ncbi:HEAT repeat domain-containing protein [Chondromyces crocatus]|uniref:Phosphohydrolase n=1 Tax=Chondromyces crocatus TaxID=52 RepID=A0A0K1EFG0_CHOCO|nr:HEAT repeat domain-containing protein [Chondromyces crocatus]AKT39323.1 phosphohydrolase [Chondromyces crocatus]
MPRALSVEPRRRLRVALAAALSLAPLVAAPDASAFLWPNVSDQIARALTSGDVVERRLAAQRLGELPLETAQKLVQRAMADPDVEVRLRVAQAAIGFRLPRAGDLVIDWLGEGDARLRLAACDVIRAAPTDRSVTALGRVLGDPDPNVRIAAAAAMGSSGLTEAVSALLGHLDDTAPEVRAEVGRALGRIGDARAVVPLIGKVQDAIPEVRRAVARSLGELGDTRAVSALMLALQDTAQEVRIEAVNALGKLRSDEATLAIAPLASQDDTDAGTLGSPFGFPRMPGRPQDDRGGRGEVREAALRALGRIGSEAAVKLLVAALAKDDAGAPRSPVRDALVASGKTAAPALVAALSGSPLGNTGAGAALVLGRLGAASAREARAGRDGRDAAAGTPASTAEAGARADTTAGTAPREAREAIVRGMQRGVVPLRFGLRALADLGDPAALPTVLELLGDEDPSVRREAILTSMALLDPARADGRAVDPARALLQDVATPLDERIELARLLGRTGSPRAQEALLPLVKAKSTALRLAALEALGSLRISAGAADKVLLGALDDESADVRLRAAVALSRVAGKGAAGVLLERLTVAAEQDRGALGIAIAGALARTADPALVRKVEAAVASAPEAARDALIEGLGRTRDKAAGEALARLARGGIDDRRKVAEALAGHPEQVQTLRRLVTDADPGVRAGAVWSLGLVGGRDTLGALGAALKDPDVTVAGNAAATIGRVAARTNQPAAAPPLLCPALTDSRPYVRANALSGLTVAGARCDRTLARDLLARDPAEAVRLAAAEHLTRSAREPGKEGLADARALARCESDDRNAMVALRCARAPQPVSARPDSTVRDGVAVFVVPEGRRSPLERAPFALVRPDGLMRLGLADRRGALFEASAPSGTLRLAVPAPLVR